MDNIDSIEGVSSLIAHPIFSRLEKRFTNLFCHDKTTQYIIPDSLYIYNTLDTGNMRYTQKVFSLNVKSNGISGGQESTQPGMNLDIIFTTVDNRKVGSYGIQENILVLSDITHIFNEYTVNILTAILDWLDTNLPDQIKDFENAIKPREEAFLTYGDTVFALRTVSKSSNNRKQFTEEVSKKAQQVLAQTKAHWVEQYKKEKERMDRLRKSIRAMPEITFEQAVKNKVMLAKSPSNNRIGYIFIVDLTVENAVDEMQDKEVALETPKEYKDHLLVFWIDENDKITSPIYFLKPDGTKCNHLHTTSGGDVCTGTTKIIGQKITDFNQLIGYKTTLLTAMKTIRLDSCFSSSDRTLFSSLTDRIARAGKAQNHMGVWSVSNDT